MATVSVFVWLQEKAKDHLGAVPVTGLDYGPQWCLYGYRYNQGGFGCCRGRLRTIMSAVSSITED